MTLPPIWRKSQAVLGHRVLCYILVFMAGAISCGTGQHRGGGIVTACGQLGAILAVVGRRSPGRCGFQHAHLMGEAYRSSLMYSVPGELFKSEGHDRGVLGHHHQFSTREFHPAREAKSCGS